MYAWPFLVEYNTSTMLGRTPARWRSSGIQSDLFLGRIALNILADESVSTQCMHSSCLLEILKPGKGSLRQKRNWPCVVRPSYCEAKRPFLPISTINIRFCVGLLSHAKRKKDPRARLFNGGHNLPCCIRKGEKRLSANPAGKLIAWIYVGTFVK